MVFEIEHNLRLKAVKCSESNSSVVGIEVAADNKAGTHADKNGRVLIVDDDEDILVAGRLLLKREFSFVATCGDPMQIPERVAEGYDVVLLDMNFSPGEASGAQGFYWLRQILTIDPAAVVIFITAHGGIDVAVEAMKEGATDFVAKPWENEKLIATVSAGVKLRHSRSEATRLRRANTELAAATRDGGQPMLGSSPAMQAVHELISRTGPTEANVLILGENGTGKELAARALHAQSGRADGPFMTIDLGAVAESVFESEVFGHVKGAFTDAHEDRMGRLQAAEGGTVFLDEVGNLPRHLQVKLLSALESREVTPVGADRAVEIDVRVVSATNMPVSRLRDESVFRQDLLFRLNTVELALPPLRNRPEDVETLARHYALLYARRYGRPEPEFAPGVMEALAAHDWPGNVRALRHALERAIILSSGSTLDLSDFQLGPASGTLATAAAPGDGDLNLERVERKTIEQALRRHRYNISQSAKDLGLTRAALYRRMEKHGL